MRNTEAIVNCPGRDACGEGLAVDAWPNEVEPSVITAGFDGGYQ